MSDDKTPNGNGADLEDGFEHEDALAAAQAALENRLSLGGASMPLSASRQRRCHSREKSAWICARISGATLTGPGIAPN